MSKMARKMIAEYHSDIGGKTYKNVPFKIREGLDACYPYPTAAKNCTCNIPFKMRALIATFGGADVPGGSTAKECLTVRFPIFGASALNVLELASDLKQCGAICIDLDGEEWGVVPPSIIPYTPTFSLITLQTGSFTDKRNGRAQEYVSNGVGGKKPVKVAYDSDPSAFAALIDSCIGVLDNQAICEISDIMPRHLIARGNSTSGVEAPENKGRSIFSRKVPVKDVGDIVDCGTIIGNFAGIQCIGYKGESIKRVDLLLGL